jgi:cyclopropane fatty-acyl-phospholipid synthase-like methyltransferase
MSAKVDLYNHAYGNYGSEVYRQIRIETYGEDLGQTSWVTTEESEEIPRRLRLNAGSNVLEIGCGSGRYALQVAQTLGCHVLGVDLNESGIQTANEMAASLNLSERVRFEVCDASRKLRFGDRQFDAVFSNDVLCHISARPELLRELFRVLRSGGRLLFSDALVIGGLISHQEIATRSSIGNYVFSPPGENERLVEAAGFRLLSADDTSRSAAEISRRWFEARRKRREALIAIESEENFKGLQLFLSTVHTLCSEGRLRRYLYVAEKPGES